MRRVALFGLALALAVGTVAPAVGADPLASTVVGTSGPGPTGSAEIAAFDPASSRLFVVNNAPGFVGLDVFTVQGDGSLVKVATWALDGPPNSVAVANGVVAVAVESSDKATIPGTVAFFAAEGDGSDGQSVTVGYLPDMVAFTPDGRTLVVANEGEPNDDYTIDPPGSVSIIDVTTLTVREAGFDRFSRTALTARGVRLGQGATVAQDLEPEYVAIDADGRWAYVALQENNAIAIVDIRQARVLDIKPLGTKDMTTEAYDFTNEDGGINPVVLADILPGVALEGLYMPDAIASVAFGNQTYLVTANEGDAREYPPDEGTAYLDTQRLRGFWTERSASDPGPATPRALCLSATDCVRLAPELSDALYGAVFDENGRRLGRQDLDLLGRLNVSLVDGRNQHGEITTLHALGGRSMSVWHMPSGRLVYDSGNLFTQVTVDAGVYPDNRSDDKGTEPEGVVVGAIDGRTFAFVGLERSSGVMVFDVTDPRSPAFETFILPEPGFSRAEGLEFVSSADSPTGTPLLFVSHEGSGGGSSGVVVYQLTP